MGSFFGKDFSAPTVADIQEVWTNFMANVSQSVVMFVDQTTNLGELRLSKNLALWNARTESCRELRRFPSLPLFLRIL